MKYKVHIYSVVRVPFEVEADNQVDAIKRVKKTFWADAERYIRSPASDFAEEVSDYLVDEENDPDYSKSRSYDENYDQA